MGSPHVVPLRIASIHGKARESSNREPGNLAPAGKPRSLVEKGRLILL
jgi:hypothetical protein